MKKTGDRISGSYGFRKVLLSSLRTQNASPASRRLLVMGLVLLCALAIAVCVLNYQTSAILSFLGVLLVLLIYLVTDLAVHSSYTAAVTATMSIIPIFLGILLSGAGSLPDLMWCIAIPPLAIAIGGLHPGAVVSAVFFLFFAAVSYTPLGDVLPGIYPQELKLIYPWAFLLVALLTGFVFFWRFRTSLILFDSTAALEKSEELARERSLEIIRQTILSIVNTVDASDRYTKAHSQRVARYSAMLAEKLGWDGDRIEELYQCALLHDIGKVGISTEILKKQESLSAREYAVIMQHTLIGEEILRDLTCLPKAAVGAAGHHERWDGSGYPRGLRGEEIPLEARIIGIADAFDAMNSTRIYRDRLDGPAILAELRRGCGSQFDPLLLPLFLPIAEAAIREDKTA